MRRFLHPIVLLSLCAASLAGCIEVPGDADGALAADARPTSGGEMTAKETVTEDAGPCTDGGGLLGGGGREAFCATRVVDVAGALRGFASFEVALQTFNGDVTVAPSRDDSWALKATLRGRGATAQEAKERLDAIELAWAHEAQDGHFLEATARPQGRSGEGQSASFELALPRGVAYMLVARTTNGGVDVQGLRTSALALAATNGRVEATAEVEHADLSTTNGGVEATLTPVGQGRLRLHTTNGAVDLALPEDARRGYEVEASTTNGEVEIRLRDGEVGPCPKGSQYYTPPCNHRTFRTDGYASRDIRTSVDASTTNGRVTVRPS